MTMFFAVAFGPAGIGISAVLNVIFGLVSSGATTSVVALPPFYLGLRELVALALRKRRPAIHALLRRLPRRRAARRQLAGLVVVFSVGDGRFEAAGLEDAVWMIGLYLAGAAVLGYLISLVRDLFARRDQIRLAPEYRSGEPVVVLGSAPSPQQPSPGGAVSEK